MTRLTGQWVSIRSGASVTTGVFLPPVQEKSTPPAIAIAEAVRNRLRGTGKGWMSPRSSSAGCTRSSIPVLLPADRPVCILGTSWRAGHTDREEARNLCAGLGLAARLMHAQDRYGLRDPHVRRLDLDYLGIRCFAASIADL